MYVRIACLALLAAAMLLPATASARGTVQVRQSDGSIKIYQQVEMRFMHSILWLRSADGHGALEIATSACRFGNDRLSCLPYGVALHQDHTVRAIPLASGTVTITLSTNAVRASLRTQRNTRITVAGTLDEVRIR